MRVFFGVIVPSLCVITSGVAAIAHGDFAKASFFAILAFGGAILWNMEVKK